MKATFLQLLDYEHWANNRVIESLQAIDSPPDRAIQLLSHILAAQEVWYNRLIGGVVQLPVWPIVPIQKMTAKADDNYKLLHSFVSQCSESQLTELIRYQNSKGDAFQNSIQDTLLQLSHHAAYHRGQVIELIRPLLQQAPLIDYIFWVRKL